MSNHIIERAIKALLENGYVSGETIRDILEEEFNDTIFPTWDITDVKKKAEELKIEMTEDEMLDILNYLDEEFDASLGINWSTVEWAILDSRE